MMGNFFNRMYYGKGNKGDYTKDDLPDNRWQLFLSMVRLNFGKLVSTNLLFLVFCLPMIVWVGFMNLPIITEYMTQGDNAMAAQYLQMTIYGMLPCFVIMGPGIAGMTYVTRNMSRDQNIWVWADFWGAVKENWKQALAISALSGLFLILSYIAILFYGEAMAENMIYLLPRTMVMVLFIYWCAMNFYIWPMMVTYDLKIRALIKNAALIAVARLPQTIFMGLFTLLLPVLLIFSTSVYVYIAIIIIYILIGLSLNSMAINSVTNAVFDKYINLRIKGARVNQGLRVEYDDDNDEYDDDDDEEAEDEEQA
ncbi:MAG: DUF624 domain-containing protein [Christensenellales bacterium]|jgi:uncharacterized membrane protein YesL